MVAKIPRSVSDEEVWDVYQKEEHSGHRAYERLKGRISKQELYGIISRYRQRKPPLDKGEIFDLYEKLGSVDKVSRVLRRSTNKIADIIRLGIIKGEVKATRNGQGRLRGSPTAEDVDNEPEPIMMGRVETEEFLSLPPHATRNGVVRYILTCAQNNTHIFEPAWENLQALAAHYEARIIISRFTYNKSGTGRTAKVGTTKAADDRSLSWDPRIEPYELDQNVYLAADLIWFGAMNFSPTATRPLSGMEGHSRGGSGIYPHTKNAMESLPRMKDAKPRFAFTTGTITQRNYIQRKAGQKADFHHSYGGLLVEVDTQTGDWWCRQLVAAGEGGIICDLDLMVEDGVVHGGQSIASAVLGDIHYDRSDPDFLYSTLGPPHGARTEMNDNLMERLRPEAIYIHDGLDFGRRNHHDRFNFFKNYQLWWVGREDVGEEIFQLSQFLSELGEQAGGFGGKVFVVDSNHDNALEKWLDRPGHDFRMDPVNAEFYTRLWNSRLRANNEGVRDYHVFSEACRMFERDQREAGWSYGGESINLKNVHFLRRDESSVVKGIEHGLHGDMGVNGARGSVYTLARMGARSHIGHSHSPRIHEGVHMAGTSSLLDMGYNKGPTTWAHAHIITYQTGKCAILCAAGEKKGLWADDSVDCGGAAKMPHSRVVL